MCIVFYQLRRKGTKNNANTRIFLLLVFSCPLWKGQDGNGVSCLQRFFSAKTIRTKIDAPIWYGKYHALVRFVPQRGSIATTPWYCR